MIRLLYYIRTYILAYIHRLDPLHSFYIPHFPLLHSAFHTTFLRSTPNTPHSTLYTAHLTLHIPNPHSTLTLHALQSLNATCNTPRFTLHTSHSHTHTFTHSYTRTLIHTTHHLHTTYTPPTHHLHTTYTPPTHTHTPPRHTHTDTDTDTDTHTHKPLCVKLLATAPTALGRSVAICHCHLVSSLCAVFIYFILADSWTTDFDFASIGCTFF